jgi:pentatricopeptide repeat protein
LADYGVAWRPFIEACFHAGQADEAAGVIDELQ